MWYRIVGAAIALTAVAPAEAQTIAFGNWRGGPYSGNAGFSHCYVSTSYVSGVTVNFVVFRNWGFTVAFSDPKFKFVKGNTAVLTLQIDSRPPRQITVQAISENMFVTSFPASRGIFEQFRWGKIFQLSAPTAQPVYFRLDGTSIALERLAACVHANVGGVNPYAPPPPPPSPPPAVSSAPPGPAPSAQREKVMVLVANMFVQAGLTNMHMLSVDETPAALKAYDLVWKGPNLVGAAKYLPPSKDVSAKSVGDELLASDAKACTGKFLSGVRPEETEEGGKYRRVFVQCEDMLGGMTQQNYIIFGSAERGYYVIGTITRPAAGEGNKQDSVDDMIARAALQRVRSGL